MSVGEVCVFVCVHDGNIREKEQSLSPGRGYFIYIYAEKINMYLL